MLVFLTFLGLVLATLLSPAARRRMLSRTSGEWVLDGLGLWVQGVLIPVLQVWLVVRGCAWFFPHLQGWLHLPFWLAFALNFVVIDYAYYWNHRLLHSQSLWPVHAVHHSAPRFDVLITSRNTVWASLMIVYVWFNGIVTFLLDDPGPFLTAVALTAALDLWRHTQVTVPAGSRWHRLLASVLITPLEHQWHHSTTLANRNFGANLSIWDRIHGTYHWSVTPPETLGVPVRLSLVRQLIFPFHQASEQENSAR